MASAVALAISGPPGTIHGTTPMPFGNAIMASISIFHSARVNVRASSGSTLVSATTFAGWAWYSTRPVPPVASLRTDWMAAWLGNSLVGTPPFLKPHTMRHASPAALTSTMPAPVSGSSATLRMCAPAAVTRKNSPPRLATCTPSGTHELGLS